MPEVDLSGFLGSIRPCDIGLGEAIAVAEVNSSAARDGGHRFRRAVRGREQFGHTGPRGDRTNVVRCRRDSGVVCVARQLHEHVETARRERRRAPRRRSAGAAVSEGDVLGTVPEVARKLIGTTAGSTPRCCRPSNVRPMFTNAAAAAGAGRATVTSGSSPRMNPRPSTASVPSPRLNSRYREHSHG